MAQEVDDDEYEESYDLKKVAILAGLIIAAAVVATIVLGVVDLGVEIPNVGIEVSDDVIVPEIKEVEKPTMEIQDPPQQEFEPIIAPPEITEQPEQAPPRPAIDPFEKPLEIKPEYEKYLETGISEDDILDIQSMNCNWFDFNNASSVISDDPKYERIFEQRKSECGV